MKYTCGFIGCGNMGGALIRAAAKALSPDMIAISNRTPEKAQTLKSELGVIHTENGDIAENAKFIFLGVKPQMMADVLSSVAPVLKIRNEPFILVTMAAGLTMEAITKMAGGEYPVIRIMPNTPASVGEGMTLLCANDFVAKETLEEFKAILAYSGILDKLPEALIDAGSAVSGCGPAFAYLFLEALADGGVQCGLPRDKAILYAAQTLLGSSKLLLSSGKHPGQLKDAVCSPGGTTIAGVHALEKGSFRAAASEAVLASYKRTLELKK